MKLAGNHYLDNFLIFRCKLDSLDNTTSLLNFCNKMQFLNTINDTNKVPINVNKSFNIIGVNNAVEVHDKFIKNTTC